MTRLTPRARQLIKQIKAAETNEEWVALQSALADELRSKPWDWPPYVEKVANLPRSEYSPYPEGDTAPWPTSPAAAQKSR